MKFDMFTGKAEAYAKARPSYAKEAIEYILSLVPSNAVFTDIGAGTGKFSELIAAKGNTIYAVEPNADMRSQLERTLSSYDNAFIIEGSSYDTTLRDGCIDVICCAQALHWFDTQLYMAECKRIGKEKFLVVVVYNEETGRDPESRHEKAIADFLDSPIMAEFPNTISYTREHWLTFMTSHSGDPSPDSKEYPKHLKKMNEIFDSSQIDGIKYVEGTTTVSIQLIDNPN